MNTARDTYNQIAYALKKGHKEGREEGREEKAYEIARKMIAKGLDVDTIADLTGLTMDEILTLEKTS